MGETKKTSLYFIATPIGNLKDISYRAVEILGKSDYVLAEDTRHTGKLLKHIGVESSLISYHKHNYKKVIPKIINLLKNDNVVSMVSDAGMPGISDPGIEIIPKLISNNIKYTVIPGPTALINAYVLSGYSGMFSFIGFLPEKNKEKLELIKEIKDYKSNLIFYVSPHKINSEIEFLCKYLGDREVCIIREMTKIYEEITFTRLSSGYKKDPIGEFVLVVEGFKHEQTIGLNSESLDFHFNYYTKIGYSKNEAIKQVSKDRNQRRQDIYNSIVKINKNKSKVVKDNKNDNWYTCTLKR